MRNIEVQWTGSYPCLCHGEWIIKIDEKDYSSYIPDELRYNSMETYNIYQSWHFENWMETWEEYEDGFEFEDWINHNEWVYSITKDKKEVKEIYRLINEQDWRYNLCGGCI